MDLDLLNSKKAIQKPEFIYTFVLYENNTGNIRHIHKEIFFPGAKTSKKEAIEESALRVGKHLGLDTSELHALDASHHEFKPRIRYRVDVSKLSIVEVPEKVTF